MWLVLLERLEVELEVPLPFDKIRLDHGAAKGQPP